MNKVFFKIKNQSDFLSTLQLANRTIDANNYLHNLSYEFALALSEVFDYYIVLWIVYDCEKKENILVHAFNVFYYKDREYYVDVRGVTDNINDILNGFNSYRKIDNPIIYNSKQAKGILKKLNLDTDISDMIYKVIEYYKSNYTL